MAKRRYETITINGVDFTYDKISHPAPRREFCYSNIFTAYERPSQTKIAICNDWEAWISEIAKQTANYTDNWIAIRSRNCNFFTLTGTLVHPETGELMGFDITYANNRCWSISEI